jgi:voltage-gated potassium channel
MIMGYGIIAVPTGIVTAELAKNTTFKTPKPNNLHCYECGLDSHLSDAKYCQNCGHSLDEN